jgi:hypothetical protein
MMMKKTFLASLVLLAAISGAQATTDYVNTTTTNPSPGECHTQTLGLTCSQTVTMTLDPGLGNVGLYVSTDNGPWYLVSCFARDPGSTTFPSTVVPWVQRQHHHRFKNAQQPDCNPVTPGGNESHLVGHDFLNGLLNHPFSDSPEAGWIYYGVSDGHGGTYYSWLTSFFPCGQSLGGIPLRTCWNTNSANAYKLIRKTAEMGVSLANLTANFKRAGGNQTFGTYGSGTSWYLWRYSLGSYNWAIPANHPGTPGVYDPKQGHWDVVMLGGDSTAYPPPFASSGDATALYNLTLDAYATAAMGIVFYTYEQ